MKIILAIAALLICSTTCQDSDDFLKVEAADFQSNSQLQDFVDFGAQFVAQQAYKAKDLASSKYTITHIYSIFQQQNGGVTNFTIDIALANEKRNPIRVVYTISCKESTKAYMITSYAYDTDSTLNGLKIEAVSSSPASSSSLNRSSFSKIPFGDDAPSLDWTGKAWPGKDSLVDANGERVLGGRRRIPLESFNSSPKVQSLFIFGLENILGLIGPKNLAGSHFELANILSVTQRVVAGVNYNFDVELKNSKDVSIKLNFTVFDQVWSATQRISSYFYTIKDVNGKVITGEGPY